VTPGKRSRRPGRRGKLGREVNDGGERHDAGGESCKRQEIALAGRTSGEGKHERHRPGSQNY
jgi:hypothetical protein